jgi:hypothetical protein
MNRNVPFYEEDFCDECGNQGAFDFMGDLYCCECLKKWIEDGYPTNPIFEENDKDNK